MGKFFVFCRIKLKFCSWIYKKNHWHTWKFQQEITSNKKCIAKKPLTNLYEMNSRHRWRLCHYMHNSSKKLCVPCEKYLEKLFNDLHADFQYCSEYREMSQICGVLGVTYSKPARCLPQNISFRPRQPCCLMHTSKMTRTRTINQ